MEIIEEYVIKLKRKEAEALKIILSSLNERKTEDAGLDCEDRKTISDIFDYLPFRDDE